MCACMDAGWCLVSTLNDRLDLYMDIYVDSFSATRGLWYFSTQNG
jgi:hypothetical protein